MIDTLKVTLSDEPQLLPLDVDSAMYWPQEVVKQRPDDPLEFLANYLKEHNPKKGAKADK